MRSSLLGKQDPSLIAVSGLIFNSLLFDLAINLANFHFTRAVLYLRPRVHLPTLSAINPARSIRRNRLVI